MRLVSLPHRLTCASRWLGRGLVALLASGAHAEAPRSTPDPADAAAADSPSATVVADDARVTAIDVMVELEHRAGRAWFTGNKHTQTLRPDELTIRVDGRERTVIAVVMPEPEATNPPEPWTIVLWLDAGLASAHDLHFAATELGAHAEALTALGTVEVVIADPEPRQALAPTRDAALLGGTLAQLALRPPVAEDALVTLRHDFLDTLPMLAEWTVDEPVSPHELATAAAAEEQRLVQRHLDRVVLWLTDDPSGAGPRRALFLANGGYDLDPDAFYQTHIRPADTTMVQPTPGAIAKTSALTRLDDATEHAGRTLAAYGWVTIPVLAPPPPPPQDGFYLGKWFFPKVRIKRIRGKETKQFHRNPATGTVEEYDAIVLPMIAGVYQENRDPEKAAAYVELGDALHGQGKLEEAAESFEKALFHYYTDHRTAEEQAAAWARLGATRAELEDDAGARQAYQRAVDLDPTLDLADAAVHARLAHPAAPLARWAQQTAGQVTRSPVDLASAVASLAPRARVTFQITGPPTGAALPLEVAVRRAGVMTRAPAWTRSATPESLAALRVRRVLQGELHRGTLDVRARGTQSDDDRVALVARLGTLPTPLSDDASRSAWLRVTVGVGGPNAESPPVIAHRTPIEIERDGLLTWRHDDRVSWPDDAAWLVVLIEDLDSGHWGARVLARGDLDN